MDSGNQLAPEDDEGRPRDGRGRYIRTIADARRDAQAAELRAQGRTYRQIAEEMGYSSKGDAWRACARATASVLREPAERMIAVESARLDDLYARAQEIADRRHLAHSNGRVVELGGVPLEDDGPILAALREMRQIAESYRKLHGLDQPGKVELSGGVRYEVVGIDPADLT
jgi:hypothetical protein